MDALLRVEGLGFAYPGQQDPVLRGLDFEVREGEIFGFLGPNGSGKSTTQKVLTRILLAYAGDVRSWKSSARRLRRSWEPS